LLPTSLDIVPGNLSLITGSAGCGKSTLARCLMGLISHRYHGEFSGEVWLNGYHTSDAQMWQLAEKAGMVFQNSDLQLFNASVREEILYRVHQPDLTYYRWLLAALDLTSYENTPPLLLSEGEKKRVAPGLVLRQPAHGLLDEPALGQDSGHKNALMRMLLS